MGTRISNSGLTESRPGAPVVEIHEGQSLAAHGPPARAARARTRRTARLSHLPIAQHRLRSPYVNGTERICSLRPSARERSTPAPENSSHALGVPFRKPRLRTHSGESIVALLASAAGR